MAKRFRPGSYRGSREPNAARFTSSMVPKTPPGAFLLTISGGSGGRPSGGILLEDGTSFLLAEDGSFLTQES